MNFSKDLEELELEYADDLAPLSHSFKQVTWYAEVQSEPVISRDTQLTIN